MSRRNKAHDERYEATNRKGGQVAVRLTEEQLAQLDQRRGDDSRASFLRDAALKAIGWNEPAKKRRQK